VVDNAAQGAQAARRSDEWEVFFPLLALAKCNNKKDQTYE